MALDNAHIGVLGAGAMGGGIAQVAAAAGHRVVIADTHERQLDKALETIEESLEKSVSRQRLDEQAAKEIKSRLRLVEVGEDLSALKNSGLVIEAVIEDFAIKQKAFRSLEAAVSPDCLLATNTSSLSVGMLAASCKHQGRVLGLHFFNPAPLMPLVEVVGSLATFPAILDRASALMNQWGKAPVRAADTPGFIVNRVARPFYGEALRIYEEGVADFVTIDWALREMGGFKMGPFELMDFIGNDVNFAVTKTVYEGLFFDPRYRPSLTQKAMVVGGRLGRKSNVGYYDYRTGHDRPTPKEDRAVGQQIADRVIAMLINEAAEAVLFRVASAADIDLAMTKGVNYPKGLLAWCDEIGAKVIHDRLRALQDEYGEDRYRPSALLRRMAQSGARFHS
jgi:3-hydroxybutyryl-CoA dehydrogenase